MAIQTKHGYIVEVRYYYNNHNGKSTYYSYIMNNDVVFLSYERTWQALANAYEKFMYSGMINRNPKIYIDNTGFIVDCYDDEDCVVESYHYKIKHMRFI